MSNLIKKIVYDKNGKKRVVWVKQAEVTESKKKKGDKVEITSSGSKGTIVELTDNYKDGVQVVKVKLDGGKETGYVMARITKLKIIE